MTRAAKTAKTSFSSANGLVAGKFKKCGQNVMEVSSMMNTE